MNIFEYDTTTNNNLNIESLEDADASELSPLKKSCGSAKDIVLNLTIEKNP